MTRSFGVFYRLYKKAVGGLNQDYWVLNCGLDAYLYLLFQREILKLLLIYSAIAFSIPLPLNIYMASNSWDWFERIIFSN